MSVTQDYKIPSVRGAVLLAEPGNHLGDKHHFGLLVSRMQRIGQLCQFQKGRFAEVEGKVSAQKAASYVGAFKFHVGRIHILGDVPDIHLHSLSKILSVAA